MARHSTQKINVTCTLQNTQLIHNRYMIIMKVHVSPYIPSVFNVFSGAQSYNDLK
jgi:hypothetical protein